MGVQGFGYNEVYNLLLLERGFEQAAWSDLRPLEALKPRFKPKLKPLGLHRVYTNLLEPII
jgi:hypothetical protein